jgi:hypothetical protein
MRVKVTAQCIEHGENISAEKCPVALAFQNAGLDVLVTGPTVHVYHEPFSAPVEIPLPPAARSFIRRFDNQLSVKPIAFEIDVP